LLHYNSRIQENIALKKKNLSYLQFVKRPQNAENVYIFGKVFLRIIFELFSKSIVLEYW